MDHGKDIKRASKRKRTDREYHVQYRKYVKHKSVKISCASNRFTTLPFCGPRGKTYCVLGLSKHYNFRVDPKLGNGKCAIRWIPCAYFWEILD